MSDDELDLETGGDEAGVKKKPASTTAERKGPGRPSNDAKTRDRQSTIKDELVELAEWIKDPEFAKTLKEGAPRMAKVLAARASKHAPVAKLVDVVFAADGPLAILRGFGPTLRLVGERVGARRDRGGPVLVDEAGFLVDEAGVRILDHDTGQPIHHLHGVGGNT